MYRHCIYCSADLGTNEAVEAFPVGRTVAVDAARGRLWAVCAKCARWNLAPIEERWEPVEAAEKTFAGARLRVQRENIGLAKLGDGTRLIRIGAAAGSGEMAAWRYGSELRRRHRWFAPAIAAAVVLGAAQLAPLGMVSLAAAGCVGLVQYAASRRAVIRIPREQSPTGHPLDLRALNVSGMVVRAAPTPGEVSVQVPLDSLWARMSGQAAAAPVTLEGDVARRTVERAMTLVNAFGGSPATVDQAVREMASRESAAGVLAELTKHGARLGVPMITGSHRTGGAPLTGPRALALEMALHDEMERRALLGELTLLESAWREAEALAGIADRLATAQVDELPRISAR